MTGVTTAHCPVCGIPVVPVQTRTAYNHVAAWYRCPNGACQFVPVRVSLAVSEEVLNALQLVTSNRIAP